MLWKEDGGAICEASLHCPALCRQLEILHNSDTGGEHGSLLWLLDRTLTVFGSRQLRSWVAHPLREATAVQERLDAVEELAAAASRPPEPLPDSSNCSSGPCAMPTDCAPGWLTPCASPPPSSALGEC